MKGGRWEKRNADQRAKFARAEKPVLMGYAEMKALYGTLVISHLRRGHLVPLQPHPAPVILCFCWHETNRHRDPDGVRASSKFILDAMVAAGVLAGDAAAHVDGFVDTFIYPPEAIEYGCSVFVEEENGDRTQYALPFRFPDLNEILAARGRDGALTERTRQARRPR